MVKKRKAKAKSKARKSKAQSSRPKAKSKIKRAGVKKVKAKIKGKAKKASLESTLEKVGEVTHYFPHVKAAAVLVLKDGLKVGDNIYIKGHTTDFKEKVNSIQLDHVSIEEGKKGQEIGLLVKSRVRIGDSVYRL